MERMNDRWILYSNQIVISAIFFLHFSQVTHENIWKCDVFITGGHSSSFAAWFVKNIDCY